MNTQQAYNIWAEQYDTNINKTRDLEAIALQELLSKITFDKCLEIGCGTGKNTAWFIERANHITAVDLSCEMLAKAKSRINSDKVIFHQSDMTNDWDFAIGLYDLVSFSLVLEHIENLDSIFCKTAKVLNAGGYVYVGELHPFKQYSGSKARFETGQGTHIVECYTHNMSDFIQSAKRYNLSVIDINEYFDDDDRTTIPRILSLVFKKE